MPYSDKNNQLKIAEETIKSLREELETAKKHLALIQGDNNKLKELSIRDELTGLYNWRCFQDRLEQEVARNKRQGHPLCLIFLDVDNLKSYNDTYGHSGGNEVLKAVAQSILQSIRKEVDSAYRFGGDEFSVILPEVRYDQAIYIANRIVERLSDTAYRDVSLSFGIAELTADMDNELLLKYADQAMYIAKNNSKNRIHVYKELED
jgi:two-component system, cell cycle response regulator